MKEINRGKQMKSVWEIKPPETWEKRLGKHPTQKPVALLERILLASTNEGDTILDPFLGGGTTLLTALRLRRSAVGAELDAEVVNLSIRRLCFKLVQLEISVSALHFSVDPLELALAVAETASILGIDDKNGINACKLLKLSFTTAIGVLLRGYEKGLLDRSAALTALASLARHGRYKDSIIEDAKQKLEPRI